MDSYTMDWLRDPAHRACNEAMVWLEAQPDLPTAWRVTARGDWQVWLLRAADVRDEGLRRIALRCADRAVRQYAPAALDAAAAQASTDAGRAALCEHAARLRALPAIDSVARAKEARPIAAASAAASYAAYAAAASYAAYAADAAYAAYASAAAAYAAYASAAASYAAYVAYAASYVADAAAYAAYARTAEWSCIAEDVRREFPLPPTLPEREKT